MARFTVNKPAFRLAPLFCFLVRSFLLLLRFVRQSLRTRQTILFMEQCFYSLLSVHDYILAFVFAEIYKEIIFREMTEQESQSII